MCFARRGAYTKIIHHLCKILCHTHNFAWGLRYYFLFTRFIVANHYPELNHVANVGGLDSKTRDVETSLKLNSKPIKMRGKSALKKVVDALSISMTKVALEPMWGSIRLSFTPNLTTYHHLKNFKVVHSTNYRFSF